MRKILVLLIALAAVWGAAVHLKAVHREVSPQSVRYDPARSLGSPRAPLKIIEFIDFRSPQTAEGFRLWQKYRKQYPGEIFIFSRTFPSRDQLAVSGALYALCAARQDGYWAFYELLMARQQQWLMSDGDPKHLLLIAAETGLDMPAFKDCLKSDESRSLLEIERAYGESFFLPAAPAYVVNGRKLNGVEALKKKLFEYFGV